MSPRQQFILKWRIGFDVDFVLLGSKAHQAEKPIASVGTPLVVRQDLVHVVAVVSFAGEQTRFGVGGVELPIVAGVFANVAAHDQKNVFVFPYKLLPHSVAVVVVREI